MSPSTRMRSISPVRLGAGDEADKAGVAARVFALQQGERRRQVRDELLPAGEDNMVRRQDR
ncbi:MAG: hypothetical protein ABSE62_04555 [Chthoniobacteraceae bacterium]